MVAFPRASRTTSPIAFFVGRRCKRRLPQCSCCVRQYQYQCRHHQGRHQQQQPFSNAHLFIYHSPPSHLGITSKLDNGIVLSLLPRSISNPQTRFSSQSSSSTLEVPVEDGNDAPSTLEETYTRLTQLEHILHRSSMYIGPTEQSRPTLSWVLQRDIAASSSSSSNQDETTLSSSSWAMEQQELSFYPALLKVFDEILVNASDNRIRHPKTCNRIDVFIHRGDESSKPYISIQNNGISIPVQIHKKENIYVPELLFGHLLTGSNFNDDQKRLTGGRHGYGAKLTNVFSKEFMVEIRDTHSSKGECRTYKQKWENNMHTCHEPEIQIEKENRNDGKKNLDYTKISFVPDLALLANDPNMKYLPDEAYKLMRRRVVDIAGCSEGKLTVTLNGEKIDVSGFKDYLNLYRQPSSTTSATTPMVYHKLNHRWEVAIGLSDTKSLESISFVNGMSTSRGGTHVHILADQISNYIADHINKKYSKRLDVTVTPRNVRRNLLVCVNCLIENPSFDTQMKDYLTSNPENFGSQYELPSRFLRKLVMPVETTRISDDHDEDSEEEDDVDTGESGGPGIVEEVLKMAVGEQRVNIARLLNAVGASKKQSKSQVLLIPKLEDANFAGGKNSVDCTLILTEGDSAKALAVAGLEIIGRDHHGVFPLRGKLLNVRDVSAQRLAKNAEIKSLCSILGLQFKKSYETWEERKELRYGHVMLMTDQDADGSHIKGLFMNFLREFWPALLRPPIGNSESGEINDRPFLSMFVTPLLKATKKGKKEHVTFFSMAGYNKWRESLDDDEIRQWKIKYYKGLGTSTSAEAKEYFTAFIKHHRPFRWQSESEDGWRIDMAFGKDRADERKDWILKKYDIKSTLSIDENDGNSVTYGDFVDNELIHFSNANNVRALPSVIDGLKPSQRKVLYACFKRNLKDEVKVAQLAGYCAEHTAYHHGEASLHSTIIGMAQDFVGSNNINLLTPSGQFGTRLMGGSDAASPRYIFTHLSPLARLLFPDVDDMLLNYKEEEGQRIEPEYFCPVIPLLLINGCKGIGTGWSTVIPQHNPRDVLACVRAMIDRSKDLPKMDLPPIKPWVRDFTGDITVDEKHGSYMTKGIITKTSESSVSITELPVGVWTNSYKKYLVDMMKKGKIQSFVENHTTTKVSFDVKVDVSELERLMNGDIHKSFKLQSEVSTRNMHAFSSRTKIIRYKTPEQIANEFFPVRLDLYCDRKSVLESNLEFAAALTRNKARFVEMVSAEKIDLLRGRKSKEATIAVLEDMKFSKLSELDSIKMNNAVAKRRSAEVVDDGSKLDDESQKGSINEYDYLLNMPLSSLTSDKIESLNDEATKTDEKLKKIQNIRAEDLWNEDLDRLEPHL